MGMNRPRRLRPARSRWLVMAVIAVAAASLSWVVPPASGTVLAKTIPTATAAPSPPPPPPPPSTPPPQPSSSWAIIPSPNSAGSRGDDLTSVSCTQGPVCMAVGHGFGRSEHTLAESWDGSAWSVVPTPNGGDTSNVLVSNVLNAVSCISAQACTAVGEYVAPGAWHTLIESWGGSAWSIVPSPNVSPSLGNYLDGVSCLSATFCTAVGSFISKLGDRTLVETWDGSTWSIVPSPDTGYIDGLLNVSCTSASACTAVGESRPRFRFDRTLVETWDGKAWSVVASPDASTFTNVLADVSCPTAAQCVAVGTFFNGSEFQLLSMSWDGSSWSLLPNPGLYADGTGVTCSSATDCTEVGASGLVNSWDGKTWTLDPTPTTPDPRRRLNSISCVLSVCVAVGNYTESAVQHTFVEQGCKSPAAAAKRTTSGTSNNGAIAALSRERASMLSLFARCPLDVAVYPLEGRDSGSPVTVGLHWSPKRNGPSFFNPGQTDPVPAYLPQGGDPSLFSQKCGTGCSDVVVTVKDVGPEGQFVPDATVTLQETTVGPSGTTYPYPTFLGLFQFAGDVCAVEGDAEQSCGTSATAETNDKGEAFFRYWAPGVVQDGYAALTANAHGSSPACGCGRASGMGTSYVYVQPDIVFARNAPLPASVLGLLHQWARGELLWSNFSTVFEFLKKRLPELQILPNIAEREELAIDLTIFDLFKLDPTGLLILDQRDYAHGLLGNSFFTNFTNMLKNYASYLDNTPDINKGSVLAAQYMQLTLSEQSYCSNHGAGSLSTGSDTVCQTIPNQHSHILFSLSANKTKSDLIVGATGEHDVSGSFKGSAPTSVVYNTDWMPNQLATGGLIQHGL